MYIGLDEKPEKGERKLADEQALLIADIIDQFTGEATEEQLLHLQLFKISLLEFSYVLSKYNFDSALGLLRSFDKLGLSTSFAESYDPLDIKGV